MLPACGPNFTGSYSLSKVGLRHASRATEEQTVVSEFVLARIPLALHVAMRAMSAHPGARILLLLSSKGFLGPLVTRATSSLIVQYHS